jgi:hypothetical protein
MRPLAQHRKSEIREPPARRFPQVERGRLTGPRRGRGNRRAPNGLLIPPRFSVEKLLGSPRFGMQKTLLRPLVFHGSRYRRLSA